MAFEEIRAAINALLEEIVARPEDRHVLQEQLREKISELRALGLPVPADLERFEKDLSADDADDFFDNMPI
jgi:Arc/MetJ-type ribon-helix-helix transcriptional regulator